MLEPSCGSRQLRQLRFHSVRSLISSKTRWARRILRSRASQASESRRSASPSHTDALSTAEGWPTSVTIAHHWRQLIFGRPGGVSHLFYMAIMTKKGLQSCGCRTCLPPAELKQAQNQAPRIFPSKEVLLHVLTSPRLYLKLDPTWFIQRIDLRLPLAQLLPQLRKRRQQRLPLLRASERRSDPSKKRPAQEEHRPLPEIRGAQQRLGP